MGGRCGITGAEAKEALMARTPVVYDGMEFAYISAVIYRHVRGVVIAQVELLDKAGNSVVIANPEKMELKKEAEG